jgi:Ribbon-helix-helix protein, copG family.
MADKKRFAGDNPAMQFISRVPTESVLEDTGHSNGDGGANIQGANSPMRPETRSKKMQILMQQKLYHRLRRLAEQQGASVNELIHRAVTSFVELEEGKQ